LIKSFQDKIISNVGSVGLSFDGDKRAAYAQFTYHNGKWSGEIIRVEYDLSSAARDYHETGFIPEAGPLAELVLAELKLGWPQLSCWFQQYERSVLSGVITLKKAVNDYLLAPSIEQVRQGIPMSYPYSEG
jgi:hypothetical protein